MIRDQRDSIIINYYLRQRTVYFNSEAHKYKMRSFMDKHNDPIVRKLS